MSAQQVNTSHDDVVVLPRDAVMRMMSQVNVMYAQWPKLVSHAEGVKTQQVEHERRIVQLEKWVGVHAMKSPIVYAKFAIYIVLMGIIFWAEETSKIDHAQMITDMVLLSGVLIGALGLKGASDSFGASLGKYLQPILQLLGASGQASGSGTTSSGGAPDGTTPPTPVNAQQEKKK